MSFSPPSLATLLVLLGSQWLAGELWLRLTGWRLWGSPRRSWAGWIRAARIVAAARPAALSLASIGWIGLALLDSPPALPPLLLTAVVACGGPLLVGCALFFRAGARERAGRLSSAQRLSRPAAWSVALGAGSLAVVSPALGLGPWPAVLPPLAIAALAWTAGLAGKPRPAGTLASAALLPLVALLDLIAVGLA